MNLNDKQIEFFNIKYKILSETKKEIRAIVLTALKINANSKNKKEINNLFQKYLTK